MTYERAMLTIIAACAIGLLGRDLSRREPDTSCGKSRAEACWVQNEKTDPLIVEFSGHKLAPPVSVSVDNVPMVRPIQ